MRGVEAMQRGRWAKMTNIMSNDPDPPAQARTSNIVPPPQKQAVLAVRDVAKQGAWAGLFNLMSAVIRYADTLILTRMLGTELYGLFGLANTVVSVASVTASIGLPTALVHFVAKHAAVEEWGRVRWFLRTSLILALISGLSVSLLFVMFSPWVAHTVFRQVSLTIPLIGLALALPFLVLYLVCAGVLCGLNRVREKVFIERIAHPLVWTALLLMGGIYFRNLQYVLFSYVVGVAVVLLLSVFWLRRRVGELPPSFVGPQAWRDLLSFSTPVLLMNLLQQLLLQSDVLIMGFCQRPAGEIGVYLLASRLAQGVNTLPTDAIGTTLAPRFSSLMSKGDKDGLRHLVHTSTRWLFLLGTFLGLGLILGGHSILRLFGRDFGSGYLFLCVIASGQVISAAFGANGTLITMTGHPKTSLANSLCMGLGNLGLGILLVPRYGGLGAAAAAATSLILLNVTRAIEIRLILKIAPWDRTIFKPLLGFAGAALAGAACYHWVHPLSGAILGLILCALFWKLLGPEPEDAGMVGHVLARFHRSSA